MRLLLDAHVSATRIAAPLRDRGHDVLAVDEHRSLDGASDEDLLELAAREGRVMVTFDVKDFPGIVRRWADAGRSHSGCAIVVGIGLNEFGATLAALDRDLAMRPRQEDWRDYTGYVARSSE